jgi:hypothetical protein
MKKRVDDNGRECASCGKYKAWDEYVKNVKGTRGHGNRCDACRKAWRSSDAYKKANRERARRNYENPEKRDAQKMRMRAYYAKPEVKERLDSEEHREANRTRVNRFRDQNRVRSRAREKEYQRRYMLNPAHRLSNRMSGSIRKSLISRGASKKRAHWEDLLGYTAAELKLHLESQFEPDMTWENYGEWHIDHVVPVRSFQFSSIKDDGFKRCWAMPNLSPRWTTTAIAKAHGSVSIGNMNKGSKPLLQFPK